MKNEKIIYPNTNLKQISPEQCVQSDRAWTKEEFGRMLMACSMDDLWTEERLTFLYLGHYTGLRVEEAFRIDRVLANEAIKSGCLYIADRQVRINKQIKNQFQKLMDYQDGRIFLLAPRGHSPQTIQEEFLTFIAYHGKRITRTLYDGSLTYNGLRNTFAAELFYKLKSNGNSDDEAIHQIGKFMGEGGDESVQR